MGQQRNIFMESLLARLGTLQHWEIVGLVIYLFYQGIVLTIFPEEVVVVTLGLLWSQDRISFLECMLAVWIGLLPANATMVFIGSRIGPKILKMRPFCWVFKKDAVNKYTSQIRRSGKWVVFGGRFTPLIRGPIYLAAGLSQMGVLNFMKVDFLASCIQVPMLLIVGHTVGKNADALMAVYDKIGIAVGIVFLNFLLWKWLKQKPKLAQKLPKK